MEVNKKRQKIAKAFKVAIEGITYIFKNNRFMKLHYVLVAIMIIGSLMFKISKVEQLLLVFTVGLIVVCEMVNTAIEKTIDMMTDENNELANIAKDVSSGGVIIATLNSIFAICVIFYEKLDARFYSSIGDKIPILVLIIILLVLGIKSLNKDK